jgi:hypothetical protein
MIITEDGEFYCEDGSCPILEKAGLLIKENNTKGGGDENNI